VAQVGPAVDLPEPGHPGLDRQPPVHVVAVKRGLCGQRGPGPDQGHLAEQHVDELGDLVDVHTFTKWLEKTVANIPENFPADGASIFNPYGTVHPVLYVNDVRTALVESLRNLRKGEAYGKLIATIFEAIAEPHLIQPTIVYDFPLAVSPLSKVKPDEPDWVERFEFYIGGFELGNAFSELNDPEDQRRRFEAQIAERERGDDEAHQMDEDYVRALSYGLPPTGGEGIGIDRLTMILTGSKSIRDVVLFPLLRPQSSGSGNDDEIDPGP